MHRIQASSTCEGRVRYVTRSICRVVRGEYSTPIVGKVRPTYLLVGEALSYYLDKVTATHRTVENASSSIRSSLSIVGSTACATYNMPRQVSSVVVHLKS